MKAHPFARPLLCCLEWEVDGWCSSTYPGLWGTRNHILCTEEEEDRRNQGPYCLRGTATQLHAELHISGLLWSVKLSLCVFKTLFLMQSNPALTETPFLFKMVLEALTWAKARKIKYLKSVKKQNYNYSHMNRKLIL